MTKKVIVIGAGVAGLASAIRLQHAGYQVEIHEKDATPGGKMNRLKRTDTSSTWGRASS